MKLGMDSEQTLKTALSGEGFSIPINPGLYRISMVKDDKFESITNIYC